MDSTPAIRIYLREISDTPLLTADDEVALAQRIEAGCGEARELLIKSNLRLVAKIAKGYNIPTMPFLDLVSEGNIGLMKAVERFDWRRGWRFSTAATPWIHEAIKNAITNKSRLIRIPHFQIAGMRRDEAECSSISVLPVVTLEDVRDRPIETDAPRPKPPLGRLLNVLTAREQEVISARFGLNGGTEDSLRTLGKKFSLSHERIRQIQDEALEKLKQAAEKMGMREYL